MKKRYIVITMITIAVLVAAGCRPQATAEPTATPEPTGDPPTETSEPSATATDAPPTATDEPTDQPTATEEATATPEATGEPTSIPTTDDLPTPTPVSDEPDIPDMVPAGQSVWQLADDPYNKYSTEACGNTMDVDFYGLVAVEKVNDGVITWTVPDGTTYTLQRTEAGYNAYWGIGRSVIGGHDLTISILFTSPETLGVTYTLIPDENKECFHVFQYNAVRAW